MGKIVQFLKGTKIISRVLVVLWIFFSSAGAGFDTSQFVYTFPITAVFFLLPAILIKRKKNPMWVKARNESKIKKLEAETVANHQRKEEAIRLQQLKEESERLKKEADLEMEQVLQTISDNHSSPSTIEQQHIKYQNGGKEKLETWRMDNGYSTVHLTSKQVEALLKEHTLPTLTNIDLYLAKDEVAVYSCNAERHFELYGYKGVKKAGN